MGKTSSSSGNKFSHKKKLKKGSGFTNIRKKKAINSYKKILRKEQRDDSLHEVIKRQKEEKSGFKANTFAKVEKEVEERKRKQREEHEKKVQEKAERVKKREEAKAAAADKRRRRQKLFSKKTHKGQPYLHNHMTFLLEKIEANVKKETENSNND